MSKKNRTERYVDTGGPDEEAVKLGLAWVQQLGEKQEEKRDAILAVNTKRQLEGVFSGVVGEQAANALSKKNPVRLDKSQIHLMTKRIDPGSWQSGPVLALYPDKKLLDKIDGMGGVTDVLVVPWSKDAVEFWIDTWGASALRSGSGGSSLDIADPVAKEAVETLDSLVNRSTGITHSSDRSTCIEIFKTLHGEGINFDPDEVRAWLVAEKEWDPSHADDVREIAEGVQDGKRFQSGRGGLADDILDQWKERAED